jgi:hypothetical protein
MAATEIRAKEANIQMTVNGQRMGGSFATVKDLDIKLDVEIAKKRFPGEKFAKGDMDHKGVDFSFKTELRDHQWKGVVDLFVAADETGQPFPVVSLAVTYAYRDGSAALFTNTLHGDLVLKLDSANVPESGYQMDSWTGFCSYWT